MQFQKAITILSVSAALTLTGCASTSEPIEPRAFSENNSHAYNIANQTALTRNDSPLRDFTQDEIDEAKANMIRESGGDAALFFGSLRILTGDFIGVIDVAGGSMAKLANSKHRASQPVFIITVPRGQFNSKVDAANYMMDTINQAATKALSKYGVTEQRTVSNLPAFTTTHIAEGKDKGVNFGLFANKKVTGDLIQESTVNFDGQETRVYSYGVDKKDLNIVGMLAMPPTPLIYSVEVEPIDYTEFYEDFTSHLPQGFYVYTPSFPNVPFNGKIYTDRSVLVPAIYTQGKKYEFIKPEQQ